MRGALRAIYEVIPSIGSNPEVQIDTDELDPPVYEDITGRGDVLLVIGAADVDVAVPILDSCVVVIVSDVPVDLRLDAGETPMRIRMFAIGAEDESGLAIEERDLLISGTGAPANVRVSYLKVV